MNNEQVKSQIQVVNIYGLMNSELDRLHELLNRYISMSENADKHSRGGYQQVGSVGGMGMSMNQYYNEAQSLYKRIKEIQDVIIQSLHTNESAIQEKVAELALTSKESK